MAPLQQEDFPKYDRQVPENKTSNLAPLQQEDFPKYDRQVPENKTSNLAPLQQEDFPILSSNRLLNIQFFIIYLNYFISI